MNEDHAVLCAKRITKRPDEEPCTCAVWIEDALILAPMGARCAVDGFREWRATPYGWQNTDTGQLASTGWLAEVMAERTPNLFESLAPLTALNGGTDD